MRLHRGSSKDARGPTPAAGSLPLSASPPSFRVGVEVLRSGRSRTSRFEVAPGTLVRAVVRLAGESPEGCAVLVGETPIPLDTPIEGPVELTVVPTFSGG